MIAVNGREWLLVDSGQYNYFKGTLIVPEYMTRVFVKVYMIPVQ